MTVSDLEEIYALYRVNKRGRKEMFRAILDWAASVEDRLVSVEPQVALQTFGIATGGGGAAPGVSSPRRGRPPKAVV